MPSWLSEYFFVTTVYHEHKDGSAFATGTRKPVRADFIGHVLKLLHGFPIDDVEWEAVPCSEGFAYNIWLFNSAKEFVESGAGFAEIAGFASAVLGRKDERVLQTHRNDLDNQDKATHKGNGGTITVEDRWADRP
jgi:hypothetical protein